MVDVFPVDFTTDVGRVRKRIPDLIQLADPADPDGPTSFIFSDEEIQSFVDDETLDGVLPTKHWHIMRAAAGAIVALANNEALILKKITSEDLATDGAAVATALLKAADLLYRRAILAEDTAAAGEVMYIVDFPVQLDYDIWDVRREPIYGSGA